MDIVHFCLFVSLLVYRFTHTQANGWCRSLPPHQARIQLLIGKFGGKVNKDITVRDKDNWLKFETYTLFVKRDWKPFWSGDIGPDAIANANAEECMMEKEVKVEAVEPHVKAKSEVNAMVLGKEDALELEAMAKNSVLEGYRKYLYFLFNFIAFYGYLLGVVVYDFLEAGTDADADAGCPPGFASATLFPFRLFFFRFVTN